jgi:hypothetical protein
MQYLRAALPIALILVLAACAPAAGRPAIAYRAAAPDIITAISQFGMQIQPGGAYNFLSVETIGDRFITLTAAETTGSQFLDALATSDPSTTTIRVTVTVASAKGGVSQVAVSSLPSGNSIANSTADRVIAELDQRFERAIQPTITN